MKRLPDRYTKGRQAAEAVVALVPRSHIPLADADEILRAALQEAFTRAHSSGELANFHPLLLLAADQKRRELALREKVAEANLRKLNVQIRFYENREAAIAAALSAADQQSDSLSPEALNKVRALFGLDDPAFQPNQNWPGWKNNQEEPADLDDPLLDSDTEADTHSP